MGGVLLIALVVTGLGVLVGWMRLQRLAGFLIWLIVGPLLIGLAYNSWHVAFLALSPLEQILFIACLPFALLLIVRAAFPKAVWSKRLFDGLFGLLVFIFTLPFRFIWRCLLLISQRERHTIELSHTPSVVGRRPQFNQADREDRISDNN